MFILHLILLIKLHHHLFLLSGFNGPSAYASYLINGIDSGDLPALHQVTGEHRPRSPKTMQTVHGNSLSKTNSEPGQCTKNVMQTVGSCFITGTLTFTFCFRFEVQSLEDTHCI